MRHWGPRSANVRNQLVPELVDVVDFILNEVCDVSLITGHRGEKEQNGLYPTYTKVQWPNGKHNSWPSKAVDLQPYPYPQDNTKLIKQLAYIAGRAVEWAKRRHIDLRWGGDWDQDGDTNDQKFNDLFHFEVRIHDPKDLHSGKP